MENRIKKSFLREMIDRNPEEEDIVLICVDPVGGVRLNVEVFGISDAPVPVMALEVTSCEDLDDEQKRLAEQCELAEKRRTTLS